VTASGAGSVAIRTRILLSVVCVGTLTLALWFHHTRAAGLVSVKPDPVSATLDPATLAQRAQERPDSLQAQLDYGEMLVKMGRLDEAASVFTHCQQMAAGDSRPYAWLGFLAASAHDSREARRLFGEALSRNADDLTALRGLANLDAQARRVHHAVAGFAHIIRLQPKDADAWQRLGILCMADRQFDRSLGALSTAATLDPNDLVTSRFLGIVQLHAGRVEEATRSLNAVLARQPEDAEARAALANAMMRLDSSPMGLTAAEQQANECLRTRPIAEGYRTRGQIYTAQRRFQEAIQDYQTAIKMEPNTRYAYLLLSQCAASAGKPDMARKASAEYQRLTRELLIRDKTPSKRADPAP